MALTNLHTMLMAQFCKTIRPACTGVTQLGIQVLGEFTVGILEPIRGVRIGHQAVFSTPTTKWF